MTEREEQATPRMRLAAYDGPLDRLLDLARAQRIDIASISIAALVDQFAAALTDSAGSDLARRADWTVMAAWLVLLKSRLLLPPDRAETDEARRAAERLRDQLAWRERLDRALDFLETSPRLGRDIFARAATGPADPSRRGDMVALLEACLVVLRLGARAAGAEHQPARPLWTMRDALAHMRAMLPLPPDGTDLHAFLPPIAADTPERPRRAMLASTVVAGLEMSRGGEIAMRQDIPFGAITIHSPDGGAPA